MKILKPLFYLLIISALYSCSKDDDGNFTAPKQASEDENTALLISDVHSKELHFIKPKDGSVQKFNASYNGGSIYATKSKHHAVITHRANNFTETFNFGGEIHHGDHVHDLGELGMGNIFFNSEKPTHLKSNHGYVLIHNDADASLSLFNENDITNDTPGLVKNIKTGSMAHHGAMAIYKNGTIAVTNLGQGNTLPEYVNIINQNGDVLFKEKNKIKTSGIHGNAANDNIAIFGSNTGILVVRDTGDQSIINYPNDFDSKTWFGSLLPTNNADMFIGYTSEKGVYRINISKKEITPIYKSENLFKCVLSKDQNMILALTKEGYFNTIEIETATIKHQGQLSVSMDTKSTGHGSVTSNVDFNKNYMYISIPTDKKVVQIDLNTVNIEREFALEITPYSFKILELDADH